MKKRIITWEQVLDKVWNLPKGKYYGVPRGGAIIAGLKNAANAACGIVSKPEDADYIIDDIQDSGATKERYVKYGKPFVSCYMKHDPELWYVFPWEETDPLTDMTAHAQRIFQFLGQNMNTESRRDTPRRYLKALKQLLTAEEPTITTFPAEGFDQMIVDRAIPFFSLCEHHVLPFFGTVKVGYIPKDQLIGLSKLSRIVTFYARRLNTQEYMTQAIADHISKVITPQGVGVVLQARHLCREMRGAESRGEMVTSCLQGVFREDAKTRQEFLAL